jgi:hypothetical protein
MTVLKAKKRQQPGRTQMAEHQASNHSEINAAIRAASAIIEKQRPDTSHSQRTRLLRRKLGERLRREFGERLPPVFAGTGLDSEKLNKILAEHQREVRSVLAEEKSKTAKTFAALNENLQRGMENQRQALEQIAYKPIVHKTIPLWTAWQIDGPQRSPFASHIEATNNWAELTFYKSSDGNGSVDVAFWFYWQNPSQQPAVLNAHTDLILQGFIEAGGNPSPNPFAFNIASVELSAQLNIFVGGTKLSSEAVDSGGVSAESVFVIVNPNQDVDDAVISRTDHLSVRNIQVPAGRGALFMIHFWATYSVEDSTWVDFDFESSGRIIKCPGVQLELLTPLPVVIAP